ncbi:hypothetical protein L6452_13356 [Arctium lappa]|uniref:Uncharacterized protein n=1 Tax=Arctium lappa TaxID=4217 RepID=A0ACB9CHW6_ARCLA|nr:hypothetical protein L6452_13356 [Arctium lappa]
MWCQNERCEFQIIVGFSLGCDIGDELIVGDINGWRWFPTMELVASNRYDLDLFCDHSTIVVDLLRVTTLIVEMNSNGGGE